MRHVAAWLVVVACDYNSPSGVASDAVDVPGDAEPDTPDAPPDARACTTETLDCGPGGVAHLLTSCVASTRCVVGCRDSTLIRTPNAARQACIDWGGRLATIESDAEESCIRMTLNGAILLGLRQSSSAMTPGELWERGDGSTAEFFRWEGPGQPDDGGGGENGTEQCAFSASSTRWHDSRCDQGGSARYICER